MTDTWRALAPAKINLGLFVGPEREDGRHELVTVMQSISLADELTLGPAPPEASGDVVVCPGVEGPNLAADALAAFRAATGWSAPPLQLTIVKRIPIAGGLAGGSADAAATLRLAARAAGLDDGQVLHELAVGLGADVPGQVAPGRWLASGAGEVLEPLPDPTPSFGVLVLPSPEELSTAEVFRQADRMGIGHDHRYLVRLHDDLRSALGLGVAVPPTDLLVNELEPAAVALRPHIEVGLSQALETGADFAMVSGSGPTVFGLFVRANIRGRLDRAVHALAGRAPAAIATEPVGREFGTVVPADGASQ